MKRNFEHENATVYLSNIKYVKDDVAYEKFDDQPVLELSEIRLIEQKGPVSNFSGNINVYDIVFNCGNYKDDSIYGIYPDKKVIIRVRFDNWYIDDDYIIKCIKDMLKSIDSSDEVPVTFKRHEIDKVAKAFSYREYYKTVDASKQAYETYIAGLEHGNYKTVDASKQVYEAYIAGLEHGKNISGKSDKNNATYANGAGYKTPEL